MRIDTKSQSLLVHRLDTLFATHGSWAAVSKALGIAPSYLSDVVRGRRLPGPKVLAALSLELIGTYEPTDNHKETHHHAQTPNATPEDC